MINVNDIYYRFNSFKEMILECIISFYGEDKRDLITKRFNSIVFYFNSNPLEEYEFLLEHPDMISAYDAFLIKNRYYTYRNIEKKSWIQSFNELLTVVCANVKLFDGGLSQEKRNQLMALFMDENFGSSYIDAFTEKSENLLKDPKTSSSIVDSILKDREIFRNGAKELGFDSEILTQVRIESILCVRDHVSKKYQEYIAQNTRYGQDLCEIIKRKFKIKIPIDILSNLLFIKYDAQYTVLHTEFFSKGEPNDIAVLRFPVIHFMNFKSNGSKGLDISFIHELVHAIENGINSVGIFDMNTRLNRISNEIRTEMMAEKIVKSLHDRGCFIFDNPKDCLISETSEYERFYPFVSDFFEEFKDLFLKLAMYENINELVNYFGNSWIEFSNYLDNIYDNYVKRVKKADRKYISMEISNIKCRKLINEMRDFYYERVHSTNKVR